MKRTEPRNPPRMVSHSVDPSCLLNICMPAKTSTDSRLDRTREVPVFTATMQKKVDEHFEHLHIRIKIHHKSTVCVFGIFSEFYFYITAKFNF